MRTRDCWISASRPASALGHEAGESRLPELLALDGRAFDGGALVGRQAVESRRQQGLDRRRYGELAVGTVGHHRQHLLDEERVALRGGCDALLRVCVDAGQEQVVDEPRRLVRSQGLEQHRGCVQLPAAPAGPVIQQLRPGDAEQEQRRVPSEVGDVVDEVEERWLGPLEVVEDEDEWLLSCHPLEDAAGLERDLVPVGPEVDLAGERLDLGERPVRDPLPVGQAATGEQRCVDAVLELSNEPRLPDPGGSEQRELVGNSLGDGMVVGALELGELVFPADQGRVESARDELRALDEPDEPERCDRFRLPLGVQWIGRLRLDCVSNEPVRGCAEQRLTRRGALAPAGRRR